MAGARLSGKRIGVYARFSSEKQSESSIDDQVAKCRRFIESEGGTFDDRLVFEDRAVSGASLDRSGVRALMLAAERGVIDAIVTEDLSRVSRDSADSATVFKRLQFAGVRLLGVSDGVDTADRGGKLSFGIRSLLSEVYIDDLRYKTQRGLEGQARRGLSTGLLPFGYRSTQGRDGHAIEIDTRAAEIVVRIFALFADGWSQARIAARLNADGVAPPRGNGRRRREGWVSSGVRAILKNEKYTGRWRWNLREFRKSPGTNRRVSRMRPESDVIENDRPELRIVDAGLWASADARFASQQRPAGSKRGRPASYLFSGLLRCGECGAQMNIQGGTPDHRYYYCYDATKRGTCTNKLSLSEPLARRLILKGIHDAIATPKAVEYVRRRVAEALGDSSRGREKELRERQQRLKRTEERIQGLIAFIADGDRSEYIVSALRDLETVARSEKDGLRELERQAKAPVRLPNIAEIERMVFDLDARLGDDVDGGREALRRLLKGGTITVEPTVDRVYIARATVLPLRLLLSMNAAPVSQGGVHLPKSTCGGWI